MDWGGWRTLGGHPGLGNALEAIDLLYILHLDDLRMTYIALLTFDARL